MRFQRWISGLLLSCLASLACGGNLELITYYHTDHLGSPVAATDERGELLWREQYRPYGERYGGPSAKAPTVGYTGHMQDDAAGLVYAGARYHDPLIGRFLAMDPVGVRPATPVSFNRYSYAANNPYKFVDPDGRDIKCAGNTCQLVPIGGGLPTVNFPRPEGFPASISSRDSTFHHVYRFVDSAGSGGTAYGQAVNNQLVKNPTPMLNQPATLQGSKIDVNANSAISSFTGEHNVMSYQVPLQSGGSAVLNVTTADHAASWGIVLRTTEAGSGGSQNIVTYGEGDSFLQRVFDPRNNQSREVWAQSAQDITKQAQQP